MNRRLTPQAAWFSLIDRWLDWLKAGGLPATTRDLRSYQLRRCATAHHQIHPGEVTTDDLARWLADHEWAPETLRSYRSALRSFYGWTQASGITTTDPSRLLRKVPASKPKPRPASERTVSAAIAGADPRGWLMLMLGSRHGLRRGEICRVHTSDLIDNNDGEWSLLVHGKGSKERIVPLLDQLARVLRAFPAGWVFPNGSGTHLTPAHAGKLIARAMAHEATPHQLRHRFASRAYQATGDIRAVQELLGHASVATTQVYTADGALRRVLGTAA